MLAFEYKAIDSLGNRIIGRIQANNDADLESRLERMGLDLIRYRPAQSRRALFGRAKIQRRELIAFCFQLEQLARAGVPILESLRDLRDSITHPRFRDVVSALLEDIEGGQTLSQAMERFPSLFNQVFVNLVRAGEHSGMLPEVLRRLTESLKWQDELAAHTKKIIMYPAFVGIVVLSVMMFLMMYLVPQLVSFIENMGKSVPLQTRMLIGVSRFVADYWYAILLAPPAAFFLIRHRARTNERMRLLVDRWKLRVWPVGPVYQRILLARFAGNFALLYRAGVTVLDGIGIGERVVQNKVIEKALERVRLQVRDGEGLTASFENTGLFPALVIRMLRVGEQTGGLDVALENVSYFYNRDVKESIDRVQALIEPTLTVILGLLLGWVMLSVLGPIYDMLGQITR